MYIIDDTYFVRDLNIPNSNEAQTDAGNNLESFIDEQCRLLLLNLLGYPLFKELDSYVVSGVFITLETPQKWIDFVKGKEYTKNGKLVKWQGLISTQGVFKKSLMANYVYYHYLSSEQSTLSSVGEMVVEAKNGIRVNSTQKLVSVWNYFLEMYQGSQKYLFPKFYYKGFVPITDYLGHNPTSEISAIEFLIDNKIDFPDASLMRYEVQNQLGI